MKKSMVPFLYKLFGLFILVAVIPLIVIGTFLYGFSFRMLQNTVREQVDEHMSQVEDQLNVLGKDYAEMLEVLGQDKQIRQVLSKQLNSEDCYNDIYEKIFLLLTGKKSKPSIYILNSEGNVCFATNQFPKTYIRGDRQPNWGIFRKAYEAHGKMVLYSQNFLDSQGDYVVLSVAKAIFDRQNQCIGYIVLDIHRASMVEALSPALNNLNMDVALFDKYFYTIARLQDYYEDEKVLNKQYKDKISDKEKGSWVEIMKGKKYLITFRHHLIYPFILMTKVPLDIVDNNMAFVRKILVWGSLLSFISCFIISLLLARHIANPIGVLVKGMEQVEQGDFDVQVDLQRRDEIGMLGYSFNIMVKKLKYLVDHLLEKKERLKTAEIKLLQAQINPHFLYNTLDSIKWLAKMHGVEDISIMATSLAKLLRSSIDHHQEFVTVEDSMAWIDSYLSIQQIRYDHRFRVQIDIEEHLQLHKIPKLILQPVVENAIIHGLENMENEGLLIIRGYVKEDQVIFEVMDNGVGMEKEMLSKIYQQSTSKDHIGLYNVHRRIQLYYGEEYGLHLESEKQIGTKVILTLPLEGGNKNA
ncbi:MAG: histidine kinase [Epulopiscium sp.]|nr:histidine kinase [Candidatus Epulonipiscium sp.]